MAIYTCYYKSLESLFKTEDKKTIALTEKKALAGLAAIALSISLKDSSG